ncbi:MAG TPA: arylsulfotransferase family protein [Gaiellaceae bacterium]|nr:arylsulfotransferase family protein [Gaiellaceae bacterium]
MAGRRGVALRTVAAALAGAGALAAAGCGGSNDGKATLHFHSRPDLTPPVVTVAKAGPAAAPGDVFIAPKQDAIQKGPEILDDRGQPVWFKPVPAQATDFRVQTYQGRPVLTWWQGPPEAPVSGSGVGHGVIFSSSYRQIARVDASFGPNTADLHEFQLTPQGTALLTVYRIVPFDLSSVGGPAGGKAVDGLIEDVDVKTGRVLFTWHSLDHVGLSESYSPPPQAGEKDATKPYDYFHINSVDPEPGGRLLVSARNTHAVYEVDERTGAIVWRLGGKKSTFRMGAGTRFAWQHDARLQPDGTITIFDDEASPQVGKQSRAIRLRLDMKAKTATLVSSFANGTLAGSQGNMQVLPNGDTFVGWGAIPRVTEFSPAGGIVFDATFTKGDDSYRAYRFRWTGRPATRPAIAVAKGGGDNATVYASWNGATAVARWQALAGINADNLSAAGPSVARSGFETTLQVPTGAPYLAVEALDARGRVLARSAAVPRGGVAIG